MQTDRLTFSRWLARDFALTVSVPASAGRSGPVPLTYYYPYSGQTPPGGVTGRLVDLGLYPAASGYTAAFWAPGPGRDRPGPDRAAGVLAGPGPDGDRRLVPGQSSAQAAADYAGYAAGLTHPVFQGIFGPVPLLDAKNAGVLGVVVAWTGVPDDEAANQYNPFTTSYPAGIGPTVPRSAIPAARPSGSATRPEPSWPAWPRAARPAPRSCSPRTSPQARRPRRSGAGWKARGTRARTSSSTPTPTGRTRLRRTAGSGSSRWPGTWRACPRATTTSISRWSRGISSCRSSAAPS